MAQTGSQVKGTILPLALATLTGMPLAATLTTVPASAASAHAANMQTFKGQIVYANHGPVQVAISVKNKKITNVSVGAAPEGGRSYEIQSEAIPILKQETLRAQSARISTVSGATDTSDGYISSLGSAISKARKAKALK